MKKSIRKKILLQMFLYMCLLPLLFASAGFGFELKKLKDASRNIAASATSFARIAINPDSAKNYITTRKTDEHFTETLEELRSYAASNDAILRISLISYNNSMAYCIYDTNGNRIGTKVAYDEYTASVKDALLAGEESWDIVRNDVFFSYAPLRTTDGQVAGYVVVELDYTSKDLYLIIVLSAISVVALLSYIVGKLFIRSMDASIFAPIEKLSRTALEFTGSVSHGESLEVINIFATNRNDEIGHLSDALKKMVNDINDSTENLSNALFAATHDSMTHVFNKRHYETISNTYAGLSSICVIYFDVNNLKLINDTEGHDRGDYVIVKAAEYIRRFANENCACFRMGGDEFLLVLMNCTFKDMDAIIDQLERESPIILSAENDDIKCSLAYGYAYAKGSYSYEELLSEAEEKMYLKKAEIKKLLNMPER